MTRKEFDKATRGAIGTRFSDEDGNLYMPDRIGLRTVSFKKVESKRLVLNNEGTKKIIIKI